MKGLFYIDESGNTGTDWLNSEQPYFVYGGWFILNDKKSEIESYLLDISSKYQGSELKSKNFFRNQIGFSQFKDIYDKLITNYEALPIFGITDKKFMIAAKIVETFFDCAYNPAVNGYLTGPVELKRALASCIAKDENVIGKFASLISGCTISLKEMFGIKQQLINLFELQKHPMVADSLRELTKDNLIKMINEFESITHNGTKKSYLTLTGTMLIELLKNAELLSSARGIPVRVYHDSLRGYDTVFQELKSIFLKDDMPVIAGTKERFFLTRFPHIKSIDMVDSKNELIVQAADLLCGFISKSTELMQTGNTLDALTKEIYFSLIKLHDIFIEQDIQIWNWYASYEFEVRFFNALNPSSRFAGNDLHSIINNDFIKAVKQ